jgi:hypothetical protein
MTERIYSRIVEIGTELREALLREDWDLRLKQTILFADRRVNSLRWKRGYAGPLPDGHDANSIAAEAIRQLFEGDCQITTVPFKPEELDNEIMRLVSNLTHNLLRRKETVLTRSEQELVPANDAGDEDSGFERVRGNGSTADDEADRNESKARLQQFKDEFTQFIQKEPELKDLFDCLCAGILKREEIAQLLEIEVLSVTNLRKKLDRRLADFAEAHPQYPKTFIEEMTNV